MSTIEKTATKSALEQIEKEIRQIDQLVNSWSDGRSLRFDPAHVKPPVESEQVEPKEKPAKTLKPSKAVFLFNLIAFCFPIAFVAIQTFAPLFSTQVSLVVLTMGIMMVAGGNLLLSAYGIASSKKSEKSSRPTRNSRSQKQSLLS